MSQSLSAAVMCDAQAVPVCPCWLYHVRTGCLERRVQARGLFPKRLR